MINQTEQLTKFKLHDSVRIVATGRVGAIDGAELQHDGSLCYYVRFPNSGYIQCLRESELELVEEARP